MSGLLGNPAITNLVFSLGAMQVARKVPTDDPDVLFYLRIAYVAIQLITLGGYFYMTSKAKAKNDTSILKYVQPGNPMAGGEGELVTTTVRDYDVSEISKLMRGVYIGCAIMCFLHGYMKYTQPLFIQSIMTLKGLYDSKPAKVYLFGQPATGDLKRPWLAAAPGAGLFGAAPGGTDAATIKEAEQDAKKTK
ncbi:Protein involved in inorganic phosphate transport [Phaffia rhodozyma]|uniref:Protein involved in inorganic phosphate transport n=1 Tax=Phaffia rhodozyma TaxID=264483 RepID=A0A0F7SVA5_PHARH|nr:Protein involved in inorganic phosphate transport [Phaffia rhodozyma]